LARKLLIFLVCCLSIQKSPGNAEAFLILWSGVYFLTAGSAGFAGSAGLAAGAAALAGSAALTAGSAGFAGSAGLAAGVVPSSLDAGATGAGSAGFAGSAALTAGAAALAGSAALVAGAAFASEAMPDVAKDKVTIVAMSSIPSFVMNGLLGDELGKFLLYQFIWSACRG
jgi:hypothetical protein